MLHVKTALAWVAITLAIGCGVTEMPRESAPGATDPPAPPAPPAQPSTPPPPGAGVPVVPDPPAMGGRGGSSPPAPTTPPAPGTPPPPAPGTPPAPPAPGTMPPPAPGTMPPPAPGTPPAPTPPPAAGTGVTINGTFVPRDKVLVFLHIGHSNMAGRTTTPQSLRSLSFETHPQLWAYARGGSWKPAKEPLSADSMTGSCGGVGCSGLPAGAGPGMSLLRTALAAAPDAHVVSIGRGQSGLTGGFCRSFRRGGLLYDVVMNPAKELKGKVTFAGIFTMFGLSEVNDRSNNARFGECMAGVASDMREDLGEPELPFVVGDYEEAEGGVSRTSATARVIIPQLEALPDRVPRCVLIPSEGLPINPLDGHHYDLAGHKMWAERGIGLLKMKGWAPWATR
jgi:hypothetical protein